MTDLAAIAPKFVEYAHRMVWCTAATAGADGDVRTRILHPIWIWDGTKLEGWIATGPTPVKKGHIDANPRISLNYWTPDQDIATADCEATFFLDTETKRRVWDLFKDGPPPVGYDPSIVPVWDSPDSPAFGALHLDPYRLRVFPGTVLMQGTGDVLTWRR